MKTAKEFLAELERDFHMDFGGGRGAAILELLPKFIDEHRADAATQAATPAAAPEPVADAATQAATPAAAPEPVADAN